MTATASPAAPVDGDPVPRTRRRRSFLVLLAALVALAFCLRLILVFESGFEGVGADGLLYHLQANELADGHGFRVPIDPANPETAGRPPLWTVLLSTMSLSGFTSITAHRFVACVVGTCTVAVTGLAGRRIAGRRVGLISAAMVVVYPGAWVYEPQLLSETLALTLVALLLFLTYRYRARSSGWLALALGATCGLGALTRSELMAYGLVVAVLVLSTSTQSLATRVTWLGGAAVLAVLVASPWTIYNLGKFEHPVFLSNGSGNTMLAGNCDLTFEGEALGYYHIECAWRHYAFFITDESVRDRVARDAAIDYMSDHLDELPKVVLAREGRAWSFFRVGQQIEFDHTLYGTPTPLLWLRAVTFWAVAAAAVAGVVLLRRRHVIVYPLLYLPVVVSVIVAFAYGETRYRAIAEIPLLLLAAVALDAVTTRGRAEHGPTSGERLVLDATA